MPAFNIAANQQLAQPVTSFFQGKAMAIAEKNQARKMEIEEERLVREREAFELDTRLAENQEERAATAFDQGTEKHEVAMTAAEQELMEKSLADPLTNSALKEQFNKFKAMDPEDRITATPEFYAAIEKENPALAELFAKYEDDGALDDSEIDSFLAALEQYLPPTKPQVNRFQYKDGLIFDTATGKTAGEAAKEKLDYATKFEYVGKDGKKYLGIINKDTSRIYTGVLVDDGSKDMKFSPPNARDMDVALEVLSNNEKVDELGWESGNKKKAQYWLATKIRNYQVNGMSVGASIVKAEKELEAMLVAVPAFFTGSNWEFELSAEPGSDVPVDTIFIDGNRYRRNDKGDIVEVK